MKDLGKFLGINSKGEKVYKQVIEDIGRIFSENTTIFNFLNKNNELSRNPRVRSVVTSIKQNYTMPKSTWTSYSQNGVRTDITYRPKTISKFKYDSSGSFMHSKEIFLSQDGKFITNDYRAWGLPYPGRQHLNYDKGTTWHSDTQRTLSCRGPVKWTSLADYNAFKF